MRTTRGARLVGHKPLSEMKLGKPRGKSGETPPQKNPAEAGLVGRLGSPAPRNGARGRLDLRRSRERVCIKLTTSAKSTCAFRHEQPAPHRNVQLRKSRLIHRRDVRCGGQAGGV